jgi:hypothetical protein
MLGGLPVEYEYIMSEKDACVYTNNDASVAED